MAWPQPGGRPVPDLYQLLGIARDASRTEITHAYRRGARALHPDSQPDDADAAARFSDLSDAYHVLSDPGRRADYDRRLRARLEPPAAHRAGAADSPRASGPGQPASPRRAASPPAPPPGAALWPIPAPGGRLAPRPVLRAGPVRIDPPGGDGLPGAEPFASRYPLGGRGGSDPLLAALAALLGGRGRGPRDWPW